MASKINKSKVHKITIAIMDNKKLKMIFIDITPNMMIQRKRLRISIIKVGIFGIISKLSNQKIIQTFTEPSKMKKKHIKNILTIKIDILIEVQKVKNNSTLTLAINKINNRINNLLNNNLNNKILIDREVTQVKTSTIETFITHIKMLWEAKHIKNRNKSRKVNNNSKINLTSTSLKKTDIKWGKSKKPIINMKLIKIVFSIK